MKYTEFYFMLKDAEAIIGCMVLAIIIVAIAMIKLFSKKQPWE